MIVYGDRERHVAAVPLLKSLELLLDKACHEHGAGRVEAWRDLTIETGAFAQGALDHDYARHACDAWGELQRQCHGLCRSAADGFVSALGEGNIRGLAAASYRAHLNVLYGLELPARLTLREPEGYSYCCLYPELYVQAANAWREQRRHRDVFVIGIRSIGCSLGAVVASALQTSRFCTVRPGGHPFARAIAPSAELAQLLLTDNRHIDYAIVDEGPGLSGSSFGAVARWLRQHGVSAEQLHYFPSHEGEPGSQCGDTFRSHYKHSARHHKSFDQQLGKEHGRAIARWFEEALGRPLEAPVEELSGGRWRSFSYDREKVYPPANVPAEARKYLMRLGGQRWLAKFVGLGASRRQLLGKLKVLGEYGFAPLLRAQRHGFGLFEWQENGRPLAHSDLPRERLVSGVARYLTFLARSFPAQPEAGARPNALLHMIEHNLKHALPGSAHVDAQVARFRAQLTSLEETHSPVVTDNKLDQHEWLVRSDGRLLKCDALEHAHAHDLIGCQDPAWDVAGATIELSLVTEEQASLLRALRDVADIRIDLDKLHFYTVAYLAFRLGHAQLAEQALTDWPDDAQRMQSVKARYQQQLAERLAA